jgi:hypothetical protein
MRPVNVMLLVELFFGIVSCISGAETVIESG